jgi:hypothetical protein
MKIIQFLIQFMGLLITTNLSGQTLPDSTQRKNSIYLGVGAFARTSSFTAGAPFNSVLTDYFENTEGLGGNVGVQYGFQKVGILLEYSLDIRYDHICYKLDEDRKRIGEIEEMLYTHNVMAYKTFAKKPKLHRRYYLGAGFSVVNAGKKHTFIEPDGTSRIFNLQYTALTIAGGIPLWKLTLEPRIQYVPKHEFPWIPSNSQTILMLRVYYRLQVR